MVVVTIDFGGVRPAEAERLFCTRRNSEEDEEDERDGDERCCRCRSHETQNARVARRSLRRCYCGSSGGGSRARERADVWEEEGAMQENTAAASVRAESFRAARLRSKVGEVKTRKMMERGSGAEHL
jgi:hypothetical protein